MLFAVESVDQRQVYEKISKPLDRYIIGAGFTEPIPRIMIGYPPFDTLYEKAFLLPRAEPDHEYDRNTATWD